MNTENNLKDGTIPQWTNQDNARYYEEIPIEEQRALAIPIFAFFKKIVFKFSELRWQNAVLGHYKCLLRTVA